MRNFEDALKIFHPFPITKTMRNAVFLIVLSFIFFNSTIAQVTITQDSLYHSGVLRAALLNMNKNNQKIQNNKQISVMHSNQNFSRDWKEQSISIEEGIAEQEKIEQKELEAAKTKTKKVSPGLIKSDLKFLRFPVMILSEYGLDKKEERDRMN